MCAKRKRNEKKLIFSNEFFSDMEQDGMLYAALIRSPVSDATLNSISHPKLPEGYAIFSAKDIIGKKTIQTLNNEIPVFCTGTSATSENRWAFWWEPTRTRYAN